MIPTLSRPDPDDIVERHGEAGERFVALLRDSASILFDLVREERIEAEAEQTGWIQPVHSPGRMKIAERRVAQWSRRGAPVELLSREETARRLGSDAWFGGWCNRTGGHINPLALTRGLARTVLGQGRPIYARSPVVSYEHTGRWLASSRRNAAKSRASRPRAGHQRLHRRDLTQAGARHRPRNRSRPLLADGDRATRATISAAAFCPAAPAMSDTHRELYFARYDARHRLVTGGALLKPINGAERLKPYIADAPAAGCSRSIGDVQFDYVWNGYIGMTRDYLPRIAPARARRLRLGRMQRPRGRPVGGARDASSPGPSRARPKASWRCRSPDPGRSRSIRTGAPPGTA